MSRRCNIPPARCRCRDSAPCCRDCHVADCSVKCLNDPARCGCWSDKPPKRSYSEERQPKISRKRVLRLHKNGLSQRAIADLLGCSRSTVCNALREMGVYTYDRS